jgi:hypothetical protein
LIGHSTTKIIESAEQTTQNLCERRVLRGKSWQQRDFKNPGQRKIPY